MRPIFWRTCTCKETLASEYPAMKLFCIPLLAAAACAANQHTFARMIGKKISAPGFADHIARRVTDLDGVTHRLGELADLADTIYGTVFQSTLRYLATNATPEKILQQIDGIGLTVDGYKPSTCASQFADVPVPCYQVVDATAMWINAELCASFSGGLDVRKAFKYGTCIDWLPSAPSS